MHVHRSPDKYMDYCCMYQGAKAWHEQQKNTDIVQGLDVLAI